MSSRSPILVAIALLIPVAAGTLRAEEEIPDMLVQSVELRLRGPAGKPRDSLKLTAIFRPSSVPFDWDARSDGVVIRVGDRTVTSFPPADDRAGLSERGFRSWFYREKSSGSRVGVRKLRLDAVEGRFTLHARRLDLSSLADDLDAELGVELVLGGTTWRASFVFQERGPKNLFRSAATELPRLPGPGPGTSPPPPGPVPPDPGPGGGPSPGSLSFRVIAQGDFSRITGSQVSVVRDDPSWQALYSLHTGATRPPVPAVDFSREIVVAIFLGGRPTSGYRADVKAVSALGDGALVTWEETQRTGPNCANAQVVTSPFVIVAVTRVSGNVTTSGSVRVLSCP